MTPNDTVVIARLASLHELLMLSYADGPTGEQCDQIRCLMGELKDVLDRRLGDIRFLLDALENETERGARRRTASRLEHHALRESLQTADGLLREALPWVAAYSSRTPGLRARISTHLATAEAPPAAPPAGGWASILGAIPDLPEHEPQLATGTMYPLERESGLRARETSVESVVIGYHDVEFGIVRVDDAEVLGRWLIDWAARRRG